MDTHVTPPISGHNGVAFNPASSSSRRILVFTDHNAAGSDHQAKLSSSPHLRAFRVDFRDVQSLGLNHASSTPTLAQMTSASEEDDCMASFSMLGKYELILVPNERTRAMLCSVMPGLVRNVYALDCFGHPRISDEPMQSNTSEHSDSRLFDEGLSHWSTFLSQLLC